MSQSPKSKLHQAWKKLVRLFSGQKPPEADPYAYVTAPKKPRTPHRSAAAVADPPD